MAETVAYMCFADIKHDECGCSKGKFATVLGLIKGAQNCIEITQNYDGAIWRLADAAGLLAEKTGNQMDGPTGRGFQVVCHQTA